MGVALREFLELAAEDVVHAQRLCDFPLDQPASYENWVNSMHPEDVDHVLTQLKEMFAQNRYNWSMEYRIRTASGRVRWVDSRGQVIYDLSGKLKRMVGINFDVTARHFTQDGVRLRDAQLRTG